MVSKSIVAIDILFTFLEVFNGLIKSAWFCVNFTELWWKL
jgi:hypothetical protein